MTPREPLRIVSGGQTGVDRAALDAAAQAGLPTGGWCPRGRRAEDGPIDVRYPLAETPSPEYDQRTEWNVRDSDGTLILIFDAASRGTDLTKELARRLMKPLLLVDVAGPPDLEPVAIWLRQHHIQVLNVAGPRESEHSGVYEEARAFLARLFQRLNFP